jgi:hypothetical protein
MQKRQHRRRLSTRGHNQDDGVRDVLVLDVTTAPLRSESLRSVPRSTSAGGLLRERLETLAWLRAGMGNSDSGLRFSILDMHGVSAGSDEGEPVTVRGIAQELERARQPLLVTFGGHSRTLPLLRFRAVAHHLAMPPLYPSEDRERYFKRDNPLWHLDLQDLLTGPDPYRNPPRLEQVLTALGLPASEEATPPTSRTIAERRVVAIYALFLIVYRHMDLISREGFLLATADAADVLTAQAMADEGVRDLINSLEHAANTPEG